MESRWNLKKHWIMNPGGLPVYPAVTFEGEDEINGERFDVTIHFDFNESGIIIKGIRADSLSATLARVIPFDEIRGSILESLIADPTLASGPALLGRLIDETGGTATGDEIEFMRAARVSVETAFGSVTTDRPKRGRGVNNDDWNARIATLYLDLHRRYGQKCVRPLAEHLNSTPQQASQWVRRCRDEGWLTEAPAQGQAGGKPGPRLIAWLDEQEEET